MSDDLNFLHGYHRPRCDARVDKVFDYHTLQLIQGEVELFIGSVRHALKGWWMWGSPLGPTVRFHALRPGGTWNHRYIACTGGLAARWESLGLWPAPPQRVPAGEVRGLVRRFDELLSHAFRPGRLAHLRAVNALEGVLLQGAEIRGASLTHPRPPWLDSLLAELADLDTPPDYAALARRHHMSLTTLRRRFLAATGQPLHAYRLQLRMQDARRLLTDTDLPLKQVAQRLGYRDVYYFNRQFAQHVGMAPGAYRRSRIGGMARIAPH